MGAESLEGSLFKLLTVVGMGHGNDGLGTLLEALAVEIDGTVLGHEPVDVVAGGDNACAGGEDRSDLAQALVGH